MNTWSKHPVVIRTGALLALSLICSVLLSYNFSVSVRPALNTAFAAEEDPGSGALTSAAALSFSGRQRSRALGRRQSFRYRLRSPANKLVVIPTFFALDPNGASLASARDALTLVQAAQSPQPEISFVSKLGFNAKVLGRSATRSVGISALDLFYYEEGGHFHPITIVPGAYLSPSLLLRADTIEPVAIRKVSGTPALYLIRKRKNAAPSQDFFLFEVTRRGKPVKRTYVTMLPQAPELSVARAAVSALEFSTASPQCVEAPKVASYQTSAPVPVKCNCCLIGKAPYLIPGECYLTKIATDDLIACSNQCLGLMRSSTAFFSGFSLRGFECETTSAPEPGEYPQPEQCSVCAESSTSASYRIYSAPQSATRAICSATGERFCEGAALPTPTPIKTPSGETPTHEATVTPESTETPQETPTAAPTATPGETPTEMPTETPSETATPGPTEVPTEAPTDDPGSTPTATPTEQATTTPQETPEYGTPTPTYTPEPTEEPTVPGISISMGPHWDGALFGVTCDEDDSECEDPVPAIFYERASSFDGTVYIDTPGDYDCSIQVLSDNMLFDSEGSPVDQVECQSSTACPFTIQRRGDYDPEVLDIVAISAVANCSKSSSMMAGARAAGGEKSKVLKKDATVRNYFVHFTIPSAVVNTEGIFPGDTGPVVSALSFYPPDKVVGTAKFTGQPEGNFVNRKGGDTRIEVVEAPGWSARVKEIWWFGVRRPEKSTPKLDDRYFDVSIDTRNPYTVHAEVEFRAVGSDTKFEAKTKFPLKVSVDLSHLKAEASVAGNAVGIQAWANSVTEIETNNHPTRPRDIFCCAKYNTAKMNTLGEFNSCWVSKWYPRNLQYTQSLDYEEYQHMAQSCQGLTSAFPGNALPWSGSGGIGSTVNSANIRARVEAYARLREVPIEPSGPDNEYLAGWIRNGSSYNYCARVPTLGGNLGCVSAMNQVAEVVRLSAQDLTDFFNSSSSKEKTAPRCHREYTAKERPWVGDTAFGPTNPLGKGGYHYEGAYAECLQAGFDFRGGVATPGVPMPGPPER